VKYYYEERQALVGMLVEGLAQMPAKIA